MGDFRVRPILNNEDRRLFYEYIFEDLAAMEIMYRDSMFDPGCDTIGSEQEICLVNSDGFPTTSAIRILDDIDESRYTNELALFNLEINQDPRKLTKNCFSLIENDLVQLLDYGRGVASRHDTELLLAGILPTLTYKDLQFENMTPIKRYRTLSKALFDIRGENFEIYLQGVDDLNMQLESVLFEACNTSFQLHLQVNPRKFVDRHNWSQLLAGPVLSVSTNSPLLFGRELWAETRIALFKQSLDTRNSRNLLRKKLPRVYFGNGWLEGSPIELWKNDVMRFPLLISAENIPNSLEQLQRGEIPDLRAVRMHNGTTYTWNRMCYGKEGAKPHLRIECRYLPAGPSPVDEIANFTYWIGLMHSMPEDMQAVITEIDFKEAKNNFIRAGRTGIDTILNWNGKRYDVSTLTGDILLPMAKEGLKKLSVDEEDIDKYLSIIDRRVRKGKNGSSWMICNYRKLREKMSRFEALRNLTLMMIDFQKENIPVDEWEDVLTASVFMSPVSEDYENLRIGQIMNTYIFTVYENSSVELARKIMEWNGFNHLPVENFEGEVVGMLSSSLLKRYEQEHSNVKTVNLLMDTHVHTLHPDDSVGFAKQLMKEKKVSSLPVCFDKRLVGIVTVNDIKMGSTPK